MLTRENRKLTTDVAPYDDGSGYRFSVTFETDVHDGNMVKLRHGTSSDAIWIQPEHWPLLRAAINKGIAFTFPTRKPTTPDKVT